jgi:hypothetical protein
MVTRTCATNASPYVTPVCFLTPRRGDALLAAPDRTNWYGRRDHALLTLTVQTGLRVSELTNLTISDMRLGTGALGPACTAWARAGSTASPPNLPDRGGVKGLAARTSRQPHRSAIPQPARPTAQYRRGRLAAEQACHYCDPALPNPGRQERDPARAASHRRHAATPSRRRHLDDRAVVGPRIGSVHPGLPPHRPCAQGTGAGPNHAAEPPPVATAHPTSCSPSSKPSNSRWSTPRPSPPRCRPPADQSRRA